MVPLLSAAFHGFDHLFRSSGCVLGSGTRPRAGLRKYFLGSSGGAPGSGELDPSHKERELDVANVGWTGPYPSAESPNTSKEPTALMTSSVRCVSRSQCASRSRTGICSEHIGHWRVSARLTTGEGGRIKNSETIVEGIYIVSTPFFTVREEGPATLKSCGTALVTSSEWLSDRFFPLSLKMKDKNVRFSVPSVCRYQLCRRPDSHF